MKPRKGVEADNRISPKEGHVASLPEKAAPVKQIILEDSPFEIFLKKNSLSVYTGTALFLIFIVFHKFLLLHDAYLFKDIGSDSVNQVWPFRVHLSQYLRNTGIPKWSFNEGVGRNFYATSIYPSSIGDPFNFLLCLFPVSSIPYDTIFIEVTKIYLGGLFFFLFLRTLKLTAFTSILGGLLYSFSGFMIIGSSYVFSTEALYAAIVLYSCEKFLRHGTWYLLPIVFFLVASLEPFLLYLYGLLITVYCLVRITGNEARPDEPFGRGLRWKKIILTVVKAEALAFAGVILSSFNFLSNIDLLLHIPRSLGGKASLFKILVSAPIFSTASLLEITTSLYRFFCNDLQGTGDNYTGWGYYIESPILYTGLLTGLLMPQTFFLLKKRKRILFLGLTILAIIPSIFPFFRHAFWIFSGEYYRTYSLFLSMLFLVLCLKTLSAMDSRIRINTRVLFITLAVLLILLFYPFYNSGNILNSHPNISTPGTGNNTLRIVVASFLIFYACLIYLFNIPKFRTSIIPILGITILIELAYFSSISVNSRLVISNAELHEKVGYNDYTNEALTYINAKDAGFFRIKKNYTSSPSIKWNIPYNDAVMQNYKGTYSYDSFNQLYYCNFLNELNVSSIDGINCLHIGLFFSRPLLSILLNEKYVLVMQPYPKILPFYDSVTTTGNVTIARDKLYLPLGYTYQNYISLPEFRKLNNFQKDNILFRAFVADDSTLAALQGLNQLHAKDTTPGMVFDINEIGKYTAALRKDSLSNLFHNQNTVRGTIKISQPELLFFSIPYDKGWQFKVDGLIVQPLLANIGFMGVVLDKGEHSIELNYEPPFMKLGCYISGFSLLGYFFLFIRYRKKRF